MTEADTPAVCVVVPVYSTGPYIRPLLDSLDAQEPPEGGFEVIFADDGSADATPDLLDAWTATRPWAQVIRLENSGWPSHPRNVAIERARAEFVFFVDHDDWLATDALRRMTAFARESAADVVIGRMVGLGRRVPARLFARTVSDARPPQVPVQDSMTVHVMFRTGFLRATGLRFDESLRRLEDHVFMATAYTRAARIAVLADAPVYIHAARHDGANAGHRPYGAAEYYAALRRAIEIVAAADVPEVERDAYLGRWMRREMLDRLRSEAVRSLPTGDRIAFFAEVQSLLRTAIPITAIHRLSADHRWWAALAREGDAEEFWQAVDAVGSSTRHALAGRPATSVLADVVSPGTLTAAAGTAGADDELAGRGAGSPRTALLRRIRGAATRIISAIANRRTHRTLTSWAREPGTLLRAAASVLGLGASVSAAVLAGLSVAAPPAAGLAVVAVAVAAWLANHSTGAALTAVRQTAALAPAAVVAVRDLDGGVALATGGGMLAVVAALLLDRRWRRTDVRAYPGRGRAPIGWIGLAAVAVGVVIAVIDAWALLGR